MEIQRQKLQIFFKRFEIPEENAEEFGDELVYGECWEWQEPNNVEYWSIILTPTTNTLGFITKYKNSTASLQVSLHETVRDVSDEFDGIMFISCETTNLRQAKPYVFSYVVDTRKSIFSILQYCRSLKNTNYTELMQNLEKCINEGRWKTKDGRVLPPKILTLRLRRLNREFERMKVLLKCMHLDRDNFLDTSDSVDQNVYEKKGGKGASSSERAKQKRSSQEDRTQDWSRIESAINLNSNHEEDVEVDPVKMSVPMTLCFVGALIGNSKASDVQGSLCSSNDHHQTESSSQSGVVKRKLVASLKGDPNVQLMMQMIQENGEEMMQKIQENGEQMMQMIQEDREENRRAHIESNERFDNLLKAFPEIVKQVVVSIIGPRPIQWIDPSQGQSSQLMIMNQVQALVESAKQTQVGFANPVLTTTTSKATLAQVLPNSAPDQSEFVVVQCNNAEDHMDVDHLANRLEVEQ